MLVKTPVQLLSTETRGGHGPCSACCSVISVWRWNVDVWLMLRCSAHPGSPGSTEELESKRAESALKLCVPSAFSKPQQLLVIAVCSGAGEYFCFFQEKGAGPVDTSKLSERGL